MNRAEACVLAAVGFCAATVIAEGFANVERKPSHAFRGRVQVSAPPSAASSYDVPISGSVLDSIGRRLTISGTVHLELAEPAPVPVPPPSGITFGAVTSGIGDPVVTAKPSGWIATLHGSGFPTTGTLRLQVAGRIAPSSTLVWRPTSVTFTVPPGAPDATEPVTGPFEVYVLENGVWRLLGRGGVFTILPTPVVGTRRR